MEFIWTFVASVGFRFEHVWHFFTTKQLLVAIFIEVSNYEIFAIEVLEFSLLLLYSCRRRSAMAEVAGDATSKISFDLASPSAINGDVGQPHNLLTAGWRCVVRSRAMSIVRGYLV